jgi:ubiquinone/menaquinone biosynthesis C-methylase UbiE
MPVSDSQSEKVVYALGSDHAERDRLRRQSEELAAHSAALFDKVGVGPGWSAIDLGCGPSGTLGILADRVGPEGSVTGVEIDPDNVALATAFAATVTTANVRVVRGDARCTGLAESAFDLVLVHARTLLINIPDPEDAVVEMVRLARPGGWVASLEPDVGMAICHPSSRAWDRLVELFLEVHRDDRADPFIGRRLPELFRRAGLVDVRVEAKADIYPSGHSRRTIRADLLRSMRPKLLARGVVGERELDEIDRAAREHLNDPDTLVMPHLLFWRAGASPRSRPNPPITREARTQVARIVAPPCCNGPPSASSPSSSVSDTLSHSPTEPRRPDPFPTRHRPDRPQRRRPGLGRHRAQRPTANA